jgi:hypothetical protein
MNRSVILTALLAVAVAAPASAQVFTSGSAFFTAAGTPGYTETFETVPFAKDVNLGPTFTLAGVTYSSIYGLVVASPGYNNFGAGLNPTTSTILTSSGDEDIVLQFLTGKGAVGFSIYYNGMGPATTSFFSNATLLGTISYNGAAVQGFGGYISDESAPITSVHFVSTDGGRVNTGLDNVALFDVVSSAPEPATLPLLFTGLVGFVVARRRRTRTSG